MINPPVLPAPVTRVSLIASMIWPRKRVCLETGETIAGVTAAVRLKLREKTAGGALWVRPPFSMNRYSRWRDDYYFTHSRFPLDVALRSRHVARLAHVLQY